MRHLLAITVSSAVIALLFYFVTDLLFHSTQAAVGTLTLTGLTSLILFSAYDRPRPGSNI